MEEFLQRAKAKLSRSKHLDKVHVVLGKKSCDLDSIISALTYAYYLEKVSPPDNLCLPVLNLRRREFCYHTETRFILEKLNIPESLYVFLDEIDLHQLNCEGKLSLTLLNCGALTSEEKSLESAIVRVINPEDGGGDGLELLQSTSSLVAKEFLQKEPELITPQLAHLLRGSILSKAITMDSGRSSEKQEEVLLTLEEKFPELLPREDVITILQEAHLHAVGLSIEEAMLKDFKEVSDGEIKVAVSSVYMNLEDYLFRRNMTGDLKAFVHKYGFDVLIILASYLTEEEEEKRQIAVYSENMELGNQICCDLEECQNPCLELDPLEYGCDQLLIYQQENSTTNYDEIFLLMKDFITRRHPNMAPNSRTSSTEAVAGSAPLSQGSSGIMELYGSDIEPQANVANFIENPQDHNGSAQVNADVNIDLVSPDSGLATIRSSRSSKESSVFLSDDSPVAEGAASHHSFFYGFDSYSPIPEGAVAEEKPQNRNSSDNFDLFNFDLASMTTVQTESSHSVDLSPADDFSHGSGSSEEQQPIDSKVADTSQSECDNTGYSSDLPKTRNDAEGKVTFDGCGLLQENPRDSEEAQLHLITLKDNSSSCPEELKSIDKRTPTTPTNSLVETSPLAHGPPSFYPQDIIKNNNEIDHVNHSHSRIRYGSWWNGFDLDAKNVDISTSADPESVFQSPYSLKEYKENLLLRQQMERRASDSVYVQNQQRYERFSGASIWENEFNTAQNEHAVGNQHIADEQQMKDSTDKWALNEPVSVVSGSQDNTRNLQCKTDSTTSWSKFDHDGSAHSETMWEVPQVNFDHISQTDFDTLAMSQCMPEVSKVIECENPNNPVDLESKTKDQDSSADNHRPCENVQSDFSNSQHNVKLPLEHQNDIVFKSGDLESTNDWDVYDSNIRKEVLGSLVSWEDPFLSNRDPDFIPSNTCDDLVVSPPDTNYSTSDSYVSPSGVGDERESESKPNKEIAFCQVIHSSSTEPETYNLTNEKPLPQTPPEHSSDSSYENTAYWKSPPNNENQMETISPEVNNLTNIVLLDSEQKNVTYFSDGYCVNGSSQSSSEALMPISVQQIKHTLPNSVIHTADGHAEICSVILEVKKSPHLDASDKESTISTNEQKKDQSKQATEVPEKQQDQQLQHDQQDLVKHNDIFSADEESGQVTFNSVQSEIVQIDNTTLLPLSYFNNSEKSKILSDYSEGTRTNGSLEEIAVEPSEIGILFNNRAHLSTEDKKKGCPDNNAEDGKPIVYFDPADHPKYSLNVASLSVSNYFDMDQPAKRTPETENPSSSSSGGENNQETFSPVLADNEGVWDKLEPSGAALTHYEVPAPLLAPVPEGQKDYSSEEIMNNLNTRKNELENPESMSEMFIGHELSLEGINLEKLVVNPQNPHVEYSEFLGTTEKPTIKKSQSYEMDSSEKNESLESLESENKLSNKKCIIVPHHELSQILDAWSVSLDEEAQLAGVSSKINETLEVSNAVCSLLADNPVKNTYKENSPYSDSTHDYTHSTATSPDISYSSTNMHIWNSLQKPNNQKENKDAWETTTDRQVEELGNELVENKTQEDSETSTEHKVPQNLDLWNAPVDDDTISSLSSTGIDEDSEYSNVFQAEAPLDSYLDKWEEDVRKQNFLQFNEANHAINSEKSNDDYSLKKSVHDVALKETAEVNGSNTSEESYSNKNFEYLEQWRKIQDEVHGHTANTSIINNEETNGFKTSEAWDAVLKNNFKSAFDKHHKHIVEDLGFPNDSSEWWNLQNHGNSSEEDEQLNPSDESIKGHDACEVQNERNKKLKDTNLTGAQGYEKEFTQYGCEGEKEEHSLAKQKGLIQGAIDFETCAPLVTPIKNETDIKQEPPVAAIRYQNTPMPSFPGDWQTSLLNTLAQVDAKHGFLRDGTDDTNALTPSSPNEINIVNLLDHKQLDTCEISTPHSILSLKAARTSNSTCKEVSTCEEENSFVLDILQNNNTEYCQRFIVDPDLWTDVEQPLNLRTTVENLDIVSHFDQDSSSQAPSSPDICHEYESKQTCAQTSVLIQPEEFTQMSPMLPDTYIKRVFDDIQQLPIDKDEIYPEGNCLPFPGSNETCIGDSNQLILPKTEEQLETGEFPPKESDVPIKAINKSEDLQNTCTRDLELLPTYLENNTFEKESIEDKEDSASSNKFADPVVASILPTDGFVCNNFADNDHLSTCDQLAVHVDESKAAYILNNDEAEMQNSINTVNETNNPAAIMNEINPLAILDRLDIIPDHENLHQNHSSWLTESANVQLPLTCISAFDIPFEKEDSSQRNNMDISGTNTLDIKNEMEECSEVDQGWGSLLIESDGTPGSSCTLKKFEYDTDLSSNDSPTQDSGIKSKAAVFKGEVATCTQDQGWGSLLLESNVTTESSYVLEESEQENDSIACERTLYEDNPSCASGKLAASTQEDHNWGSLLLESDVFPKATESSGFFDYEAEAICIDSPAGGDISMGNEYFSETPSKDSKGCKSSDATDITGGKNKKYATIKGAEDHCFQEMDYVLITGEENGSLGKNLLMMQESNFTAQETSTMAKQMGSPEIFSADSSATFQSISEGQSALANKQDSFYLTKKSSAVAAQKLRDEKKVPRSPLQDQEWTMVGQNGVDDISSEENCRRVRTINSLSRNAAKELEEGLNQEQIFGVQDETLIERSPHESLEQEGKISHNKEPDALLFQVADANSDLDVHSQQHTRNGMAKEQEMEEDTQFVDSIRELSCIKGLIPDDVGMDDTVLSSSAEEMRIETPNSSEHDSSHPRRIKLTAPDINLSLDQSEGSILSDDNLDSPDEIDINIDELDTPDEGDSFEYAGHEEQPVFMEPNQEVSESIPEYTAKEEREDNRLWRTVVIGDQEQRIDLKAIEPYKKVISHGGYYGDGLNAIIVFAACFLPDSSRTDYNYVMENLFLYVISTLELMVAEDYMIVYLNGATPRRRMPGLGWMKRCYQMIDRRLRKNLKSFIIVHPSWFIRTILAVTRPFISSKFSSKIHYVSSLAELSELIPMEYVNIPESIAKMDEELSEAPAKASCLSNEPDTSVQQDINMKQKGNS